MATADWPNAFYTHDAAAQDQDLTQDEWNRVGLNVQNLTVYLGQNPHGSDATVSARLARVDATLSGLGKTAMRNLRVYNNTGTPTAKVDITFTALTVYASGLMALSENGSLTVDLTVQGKNGREGSWARPTGTPIWSYLYVIANPTSGEVAGLISISSTSPDLSHATCSGFTLYRRVAAIYIDNTNPGNFRTILQQDNHAQYYDVAEATRVVTSGLVATTFTTIGSMAALVPPTAVEVDFRIYGVSGAANAVLSVSPYSGLSNGLALFDATLTSERYVIHRILHCPAQTLYYKWSAGPTTGATFIVCGYVDPVG